MAPAPTTYHSIKPCPFGVLNLAAAIETYTVLEASPMEFHKRLHDWLGANYVEESIRHLQINEPLGIRIRSVEDLGMLVGSYNNARALRSKTSGQPKDMINGLYFYGCQAERDVAAKAGDFIKKNMDPDAKVDFGTLKKSLAGP